MFVICGFPVATHNLQLTTNVQTASVHWVISLYEKKRAKF